MRQKNTNQLPVSPANWSAIKASVPGIAEAARGAQRPTVEKTVPKFIEIIETAADYADSMRILQERRLKPLIYEGILLVLDLDPKRKEQLKGKWFWIEGRGLEMRGDYTLQPDGSLKEGRSSNPEKIVQCIAGSQPLWFGVCADAGIPDLCYIDRRYTLSAASPPDQAAPVVVGVRINRHI